MALRTTVIGAYPKPDYLPIADWFGRGGAASSQATRAYAGQLEALGAEAEALFQRAARDVIADQIEAGIDIVTDGEVRRENYIHYHCRHLEGFDFERLVPKSLRGGAYVAELPAITGPVRPRGAFLPQDWRAAQALSARPVKVTLPGPMTIADTTVDLHYDDPAALGRDLAAALNAEVKALAAAGCRHIQIDEPLFARQPAAALAYGLENLARCWHGLAPGVQRVLHICCGYPNALDDEDYPKADPGAYFDLAAAIEAAPVDAVSLEDAHRPNDLALLERFAETEVILGVIAIARSRVESIEAVRTRLQAALAHIPPERLIAAPDCGLGHLTRDLARAKLAVLCAAARSL